MKDLNQIHRDNLEWEKRIADQEAKRDKERQKWYEDPEKLKAAYDSLLDRTRKMTKEALTNEPVAGVGTKTAVLPRLEDLLTPEDYAFLAGLKVSLDGGPDGTK